MNQPATPQPGQTVPQAQPAGAEKAGFNAFELLGPAIQVATGLAAVATEIQAKTPATTQPVRTYIFGQHVEVVVSVNPLP